MGQPEEMRHYPEMEIEVRRVPYPEDGSPAVLVQLPVGYAVLRLVNAEHVAQTILEVTRGGARAADLCTTCGRGERPLHHGDVVARVDGDLLKVNGEFCSADCYLSWCQRVESRLGPDVRLQTGP